MENYTQKIVENMIFSKKKKTFFNSKTRKLKINKKKKFNKKKINKKKRKKVVAKKRYIFKKGFLYFYSLI